MIKGKFARATKQKVVGWCLLSVLQPHKSVRWHVWKCLALVEQNQGQFDD
jgi:hypothetical protein